MNPTLSTPAGAHALVRQRPDRHSHGWLSLVIASLSLVLLAASCGRADSEAGIASDSEVRRTYGTVTAPAAMRTGVTDAVEQSAAAGAAIPRQFGDTVVSLIIRFGDARIEVVEIRAAVAQLRELAQRVGGHVASSSYQGGRDEVRSATLELKVPAVRYDETVAALDRVGRVEYVNSRAEDVGEEYADASARLANARRLEERLLALLTSRTGKLDEVLAVERELARVRGDIEQIEGRLRYLRTRAALSTLTVTVHEPEPLLGGRPGENPFTNALQRAWRNFVGLLAGLIAAMGVIVPLALLTVAGWYGGRRVLRLVKTRRSAAEK